VEKSCNDAVASGAAPGKESLSTQPDRPQEAMAGSNKVVALTHGSSDSDQGTLTGYSLQSSSPEGEPPCCSGRGTTIETIAEERCFELKISHSNYSQAGRGRVMPFSSLRLPHYCAAAVSMQSISPAHLYLSPAPPVQCCDDEQEIDRLLQKAVDTKHAADLERGSKTALWTVRALCRLVESAILFMEACEYMVQCSTNVDRSSR
jgi:hypothetical protein